MRISATSFGSLSILRNRLNSETYIGIRTVLHSELKPSACYHLLTPNITEMSYKHTILIYSTTIKTHVIKRFPTIGMQTYINQTRKIFGSQGGVLESHPNDPLLTRDNASEEFQQRHIHKSIITLPFNKQYCVVTPV